jgi:hypothetical protein
MKRMFRLLMIMKDLFCEGRGHNDLLGVQFYIFTALLAPKGLN